VAWLAVLIPMLIAAGAAYGLFVLNDHRSPRRDQPARPTEAHPEKSKRMAA
jgi:hypothetical protein